ncbi:MULTISPECIES: 16S rRNA (adenine(1518)-N(6)/adenine(1519)-N(6))-dimethyltransferase RsmA [Campylobacter]|uniref:16S rRNA (adenine(1518)-N(6)/adenine(1519)-N(6))- dimethyltransferase RsmA n=1 Tax=Campylobacter TaxID=194 RepID=UPI00147281C5|nr:MULTISPECIES: 16S rRNA (adenine(1518)-N(6)/adenine(1519)-N(6))-dimethyltransferase RsmA [unclassified Campylobacter]MBE3022844.1 16S rRNA (adenine(1518)-N(6)/adenine(1519)-N(6))-dimethyltransferase RsmA [Campylobacter sp. 7477a]MBE3610305.1 16S rRNA (adenine(1518)-N(6)/adenine(1519)-N(6))-dimethyltransferase RsmA [Campylobacter sp. RM12916]
MIKAKKKFGQNFLQDQGVLSKIIKAIPNETTPNFNKNVVEIGPGLGDLTFWLLNSGFLLTSYEIDDELVPILNEKFQKEVKEGRFRLINKDANEAWREQQSLSDKPYILVANLPYYVATKMILSALQDELCVGVIAMTQKEVALKFACKGEDSDFSALGVLANLNGSCELLFDVAPECFEPKPKVVSSVLQITKSHELLGEFGLFKNLSEYKNFGEFLKICFSAPRKTLLKNLSSRFDKNLLNQLFLEMNLNTNLRPHESNVALYLEIYKQIKADNERKQQRSNG